VTHRLPRWSALFVSLLAAGAAPPASADSLLYRCGANICRVAPDGTGRLRLTTDGRAEGPAYSWLSASRDGSRIAVSKATYAYVLDRSGRPLGGPLPRGGAALVAQIAPDGSRVATLELLGELTPPPFPAPPGTPPTLGFHPYLFVAATDGSGRDVVARDVVDTAWLGGRLLRSDGSSQPPFGRGLCLLASNTGFACERDVARDPASDLSAPAVSPDGRLVAVARSPAEQNRGTGPIALYDVATGRQVRALTGGADDGLPTFSPDGRRLAFNRGGDIYAIAVDGAPGSERRVVTGGVQPVWVTGGAACRQRRSVRPAVHGRSVAVRACAPAAGRLTVTLTRRGRRVARRTVSARRGGVVTVRFGRPGGTGALRASVRFRAA
jgi:dipeptidyl aminopeptidase/acylaminoacyl peptidase